MYGMAVAGRIGDLFREMGAEYSREQLAPLLDASFTKSELVRVANEQPSKLRGRTGPGTMRSPSSGLRLMKTSRSSGARCLLRL